MKISILTLFPDFFHSQLESSIIGRAVRENKILIEAINIRDFATDTHKTTDDRPFGGGPGMVLKVEPIDLALQSLGVQRGMNGVRIVLLSAKGEQYTQQTAQDWASLKHLVLICGHYGGVDERVTQHLIDVEVRIGEYVLTGGEPAAGVVLDSVARLIPGVLGNENSNQDESHSSPGELGYPQYTRPELYKGLGVPKVLLSGHHNEIEKWRSSQRKQSTVADVDTSR